MESFDSNWGTTTDWLIILFGTLSNASLMPKHIWPDIWLWGLHPESPGSAVCRLLCSDSQSSTNTCSLVRFIMLPTVQSDPNMFYFVQKLFKTVKEWIWMRWCKPSLCWFWQTFTNVGCIDLELSLLDKAASKQEGPTKFGVSNKKAILL